MKSYGKSYACYSKIACCLIDSNSAWMNIRVPLGTHMVPEHTAGSSLNSAIVVRLVNSVPIEVNGQCFSNLIFSQISVNIYKYHGHFRLISYLANVAQMSSYLTLIL